MTTTPEPDHAEQNARGWMESIRDMVARLTAEKDDHEDDLDVQEKAREEILASVLSVGVRDTTFRSPGDTEIEPDEFEILLSTGGPAARITGDLDAYCQPENVRLEKQDWFKPWTRVELDEEDQKALEAFTREFYFEGG